MGRHEQMPFEFGLLIHILLLLPFFFLPQNSLALYGGETLVLYFLVNCFLPGDLARPAAFLLGDLARPAAFLPGDLARLLGA